MEGSDGKDELPAPEVVLIDAAAQQERPAGPLRRSAASRWGMLLAAVALFAFGVVAGRTTLSFEPGQALRGQQPPVSTTSAAPSTSANPSTDADADAPDVTPDATAGSVDPDRTDTVPFKLNEINNACGRPTYIAQVGYVAPLPTPVDMTILAGDPPRSVDLKTGVVGPPLLELDDALFTSQSATDDLGAVVVLRSCQDPMQTTAVRVPQGGKPEPIAIPDGWRTFGSLIRVDGQIWLGLSTLDSGFNGAIIATDGSGDVKPVPVVPDYVTDSPAVSPDGQRSASIVLNTDGTPGYDIQVTDQHGRRTTTVPGIRLGAASPMLVFSPDSRWLVVTVTTLVGEQILLYGPDDLTGPYSIPGTVLHPDPAGLRIYPTG